MTFSDGVFRGVESYILYFNHRIKSVIFYVLDIDKIFALWKYVEFSYSRTFFDPAFTLLCQPAKYWMGIVWAKHLYGIGYPRFEAADNVSWLIVFDKLR